MLMWVFMHRVPEILGLPGQSREYALPFFGIVACITGGVAAWHLLRVFGDFLTAQAGRTAKTTDDIVVTLADTIPRLNDLKPEDAIYVAHPWTPSSIAIVAREPEDGSLPPAARQHVCRFFLDIVSARAFLIGWRSVIDHEPTVEEICDKLIELAGAP
jgi:hypothetical protein